MDDNRYTFTTQHGLVMSTQPFLNGNSLYATAQAILLGDERADEFVLGMGDLEKNEGAFSRNEYLLENTSIDDMLGAACIPVFAVDILWRMRTHFGICDVINPTLSLNFKQFMPRFLGFYQHCKISAGEKLSWLGALIWAKSVERAADAPISNQDSKIQTAMMILVYLRSGIKNPRCDEAVAYWYSKKAMPISEIVAAYIGDPKHPLVELWSRSSL